jgi:hypothetical protein
LDPPRSRLMLGKPRKARGRGLDESRVPQNPYRMRKFRLKGRCGLFKVVGHNTKTCPKKKEQPSNYRQPVIEVYFPTPPTPSVSFIQQYVYIIFGDMIGRGNPAGPCPALSYVERAISVLMLFFVFFF